ncbi:MAG: SAM-dependent methyltransferase [Pirellulaceae bacterium]|nr:SAM-dependent methyltransferase [Pirellulaceae bacterium]
MAKRKHKTPKRKPLPDVRPATVGLRIIGGTFRGRKLRYAGDLSVRPMKDRVREALFNLVGPSIKGKYALDLFGGTGALGLEAVSRGAVGATFVELHYPTARTLRENVESLAVAPICHIVVADTFFWVEQTPLPDPRPWVVFISPPYEFFVSRLDDMLRLVETMFSQSPAGSVLVVESDQRFDFERLVEPKSWNVRDYPPARIGILRKQTIE